jgi:hypothetical protein
MQKKLSINPKNRDDIVQKVLISAVGRWSRQGGTPSSMSGQRDGLLHVGLFWRLL